MFPPITFPAITWRLTTAGTSATLRHLPDHRGRAVITRAPAASPASFAIRRQDSSNKWQIILQTNGSILLREHVSATPTTRASAPIGTFTDGSILTWSARGTTITVYINGSQALTYASATNYQTQHNGLWETAGDADIDEITTTPP